MSNLIYWPMVVGPVASGSPLANDPYFSYVVQLAHFDGANGSTTLTNSCPRGNTLATATCSLSTGNFKYGTASLLNTGGSGFGAIASSHSDYAFGTADWTIELWAYPLAIGFPNELVDFRNSSLTAQWAPTIVTANTSGAIKYLANGADRIVSANGVYVINAWHHIALCRISNVTRLFVNGSQVGSDFSDSNTYVQNGFNILRASNSGGVTHGYMDDLRITNGIGRYSANFTPPAGPFPNQ